ncbi:RusA family crossover junction endodeoxyribonuclease [Streptomyces sp. NBC_01233]|uniref:RusA family crossover junction endodeoxyribonuclease n=1 Tax=Streptomyces sp. NBC_01233 TaxID=2903787 RepID=UPI002E15D99F|nr:RusA family crossover junction endodeoxyribonuclease [Streptomyces sp. NBC_01233]
MIETVPLFDLTGTPVPAGPVAVLDLPADEEPEAPAVAPAPALVIPPKPVFEVVVRGLPAPQGSKKHVGRGRMIESSAAVKPWRDSVTTYAVQARAKRRGFHKLTGPLRADMVFCFDRPKGHMGTGRNAGLVRPSAPPRPDVTPDLDKLVRSTSDALKTAGVYQDDALVVEYGRVGKWYTSDHGQDPDVMDSPGCLIRLWRVGSPEVSG